MHMLLRLATLGLLSGLAACSAVSQNTAAPSVSTSVTPAPAPATAPPVGLTPPGEAAFPDRLVEPQLAAQTSPKPPNGPMYRVLEQGGASWYGPGFHGRRTASGERYDMHALTAAHRTLPFGTVVRVRSLVNGREVDVRISDRGPFVRSRVIDLSRAAAAELQMLGLGFKQVSLLVLEPTPLVTQPPAPTQKATRVRRVGRVRTR